MEEAKYSFTYQIFGSEDQLKKADEDLLQIARQVATLAYAPYSRFHVGAAARLKNGEIIKGTNQENASFPAGICAERVLLSAASSIYPGIPIETIAISYESEERESNHPIAPCGICRQSLQEYEKIFQSPIRLILAGLEGKIWVIPAASALLPLAFTGEEIG